MKGYSVVVTIILALVLFTAINDGIDRNREISQLQQEKLMLQNENDALRQKIDSLDSLALAVPTNSAHRIVTRIITRYEKDFHHIDSANADESFSLFSEWISEADSIAKW